MLSKPPPSSYETQPVSTSAGSSFPTPVPLVTFFVFTPEKRPSHQPPQSRIKGSHFQICKIFSSQSPEKFVLQSDLKPIPKNASRSPHFVHNLPLIHSLKPPFWSAANPSLLTRALILLQILICLIISASQTKNHALILRLSADIRSLHGACEPFCSTGWSKWLWNFG